MFKVKYLKNGPLLIESTGNWTIVRAGKEETIDQTTIALCRCGHSDNKPFCDGSHKRVEFDAEECELTGK